MFLMGIVAGCISIATHERDVNAAQTKENNLALSWTKQEIDGAFSDQDLLALLKGRADVLQMQRLRYVTPSETAIPGNAGKTKCRL